MERWFISFLLGALLSLFLPLVPTLFYLTALFMTVLLSYRIIIARYFSVFLLGISWMVFHANHYQAKLDKQLHPHSEIISQKIRIKGVVANIPQVVNTTQRFNLIVSQINSQALTEKIKVRLTWKDSAFELKQNQEWQLTVRLKPAHGLANIGGFSYQTWLRKNNLHATGYVIDGDASLLVDDTVSLRQKLYIKLQRILTEHHLSPVISALTFGERGSLTKAHWQVLQNTATGHLIAISGLHLGLVAAGSFNLFLVFFKFFPLARFTPKQFKESITGTNNRYLVISASVLLSVFYAYLAGFSIPTLRALLMLVLFWLLRLLTIKMTVSRWLLFTIMLIVLLMPFSLFTASFWLSFWAVSLIFMLLWRFKTRFKQAPLENGSTYSKITFKIKNALISLFFLQVALMLFMLPITAIFNQQISAVALFANLVAVPWMSVTSIPLSLLSIINLALSDIFPACQWLAQGFLTLAIKSLELIWWWLRFLSELPNSTITISTFQWLIACIITACMALKLFTEISLKKISLVFVIFILSSFGYRQVNAQFTAHTWRVNVMDVGQGLAVVIEANEQVLIYDTGASFPSGFSMAEAVLLPYLKTQGYRALDLVIISHDDNDHAGGLVILQEHYPINRLMYNSPEQGMPCLQGDKFVWQFLTIEILSPNQQQADHNDDSCVIKISDSHHSVLLTGDISKKTEQRLIKADPTSTRLKSDIMVAPHHGSKTSSSSAFIQAVAPQTVIFSAGYLNRWKMPTAEVINRYHALGINTFNTANDGMIRIELSSAGSKVIRYRHELWPFWFAN